MPEFFYALLSLALIYEKSPFYTWYGQDRIPVKKERNKAFASIVEPECNDLFRLIHNTTYINRVTSGKMQFFHLFGLTCNLDIKLTDRPVCKSFQRGKMLPKKQNVTSGNLRTLGLGGMRIDNIQR